ncbi:hypothetical protein [Psychrobacillus phage Perkons]|nr:hypothetical protein [Psychrobacillus phage Perkons]
MKRENIYLIEINGNEIEIISNSITNVLKRYGQQLGVVRIFRICKGIIYDNSIYKVHFASYNNGSKINEQLETIIL